MAGLHLTEKSRAVLKKEKTILLRKLPPKKEATKKKTAAKPSRQQIEDSRLNDSEERLFEQLRELRLALAHKQNVPSYVIFHNATLIDMAKKKPQDADEMSTISGVGQVKMDRYGADFLKVIGEFSETSGTLTETMIE